jgi:cell division protein FtsN
MVIGVDQDRVLPPKGVQFRAGNQLPGHRQHQRRLGRSVSSSESQQAEAEERAVDTAKTAVTADTQPPPRPPPKARHRLFSHVVKSQAPARIPILYDWRRRATKPIATE